YGELYHRCWTPELAHTQHFRQDLEAYTAPVVRGATSVLRQTKTAPAAVPAESPSRPAVVPETSDNTLELGTRTLADLVAPSGCEVRFDHLRLDGQYARVLAVTAYPRTVAAGWLEALVDSDLPVELSMHVHPLP